MASRFPPSGSISSKAAYYVTIAPRNMDVFELFSRGENLVQSPISDGSWQRHDSPHQDLIRLIAIANALKVEIFPLTWQPALESLGQGATGWVSQSSLNNRVSFAFKRFNQTKTHPELTEREFRKLQYNAMISEIVALSCPQLYSHPNIINLEGLCWEVLRPSGEVLPVLVFRKAKYGDLRHFLTLPEAEEFDLNTKIAVCGEIAKALRIMHQCGVAHGDIKPENVLVTKSQEDDAFGVHVTDFGYSSFDTLVKVPRSQPWEAPEWHPRWFSPENAKKMDVYSFGLLCLWLLLPGQTLHPKNSPSIDLTLAFSSQRDNTPMMMALQELKTSDNLLESVLEATSKIQGIPEDIRLCLEAIFRLTLVHDPQKRENQMQIFVDLLCDPKYLDPLDLESSTITASAPIWHGTFQVEACDFKVQQAISKQLALTAKDALCELCSKNAAFELALCYSFGFGGLADPQMAQHWLDQSGQSTEDLRIQLNALKDMIPDIESAHQLVELGLQSNLRAEYQERGILEEAVMEYETMAAAREKVFGRRHFSTLRIRGFLASFLEAIGRPVAKVANTPVMISQHWPVTSKSSSISKHLFHT